MFGPRKSPQTITEHLTGQSLAKTLGWPHLIALVAFISVGACLMVLRRTAPDMPRLFRCPAPDVVGTLAILGCLYLLFSLPGSTIVRFCIWNAIGLAIYFAYSRRHSLLNGQTPAV